MCIQRFLNIALLFSNSATGSFSVNSEMHNIILDVHKGKKRKRKKLNKAEKMKWNTAKMTICFQEVHNYQTNTF